MVYLRSGFGFAWLFIVFTACKNHEPAILGEKEVLGSKARAEKNSFPYSGRFVRLEKLNSRDYMLFLQDSTGTPDSFYTVLPLDSLEISMLSKQGNNIVLRYDLYRDPVTKATGKMVRSMIPIYRFSGN